MMNKEIKERIETINKGEVPDGYKRTRYIGIAPKDWTLGKLSDAIVNKQRPVPKPNKPYWRLGIKSWAKGTFHTFVENPDDVNMEELYVVHENDLIVNITFAWEHAIAIVKNDDEGLLVSHRFPTYEFKKNQIPQFYKAVISQRFFKEMLENISPGGAGRNRVLNKKDFLNLPCYIPPVKEQEKIAEILSQCDTVIEECKKQMEEYKSLKKTCLNKMFPKKGSNTPEIRFPGFADAWEQRKLKDFVDKAVDNRGKTPPLDENGTHPLIEVAALGGVHPDYSKIEKYLNDDSFENNLRAYIKEGDILFTTVGSIGLVSLMDAREEVAIAQNIVAFRAKENFNSEYLYALFSNEDNQYKATRIVMGAVQPSIKVSQLVDVEYMLTTNEEEQKKIGAYFRNLDTLITLHQRKVDEYKQMKKALTQLLLTGIVRVNKQKEILP